MWRCGIIGLIVLCSCQPQGSATGSANSPESPPKTNAAYVTKQPDEPPTQVVSTSEEAQVIAGAMDEFFSSRWQDWNVGEYIAVEPAWTTGQFDSQYFDKALDYWIIRFGNESSADEETLKRIRVTLNTAGAPTAKGSTVQKSLDTMDLGPRVVIAPSTYFSSGATWVPGAVSIKNRANIDGGIRAKGALSYPLFSGDGHYAFLQMSHVGAGKELGQLHFFLVKIEGKWKALAVGRIAE